MSANHAWLGTFIGLISLTVTARAQPTSPVFFGAAEGRVLMGIVVAPDGSEYLTFKGGGRDDLGTLARRTADGEVRVLHDFDGFDGARPDVPLRLGPDGALYGTTSLGGQHGNGTAFRLTRDGQLTTLYNFTSHDGGPPMGPLLPEADGGLIGVTSGKFYFNCLANNWLCTAQGLATGVIFKLTPDGTLNRLYKGVTEAGGGLIRASTGALCGVTRWQNPRYWGAAGSVYCLDPDGAISFGRVPDKQDFDPRGELVEANGYLYGIAEGEVFRMWLGFEPEATDFEEFFFAGSSACGPTIGIDNNLYFTGYSLDILRMSPLGLLTRITRYDEQLGSATTTLTPAADGSFRLGFREYLARVSLTGAMDVARHFGFQDGYGLDALFLTKRDELYGATVYGGKNGGGTLFRVDNTGKPVAFHHFDGQQRFLSRLRAPFVEAADGALYALLGGLPPALVRVNATLAAPSLETLHTFTSFDEDYGLYYVDDYLFAGEDGALYGSIEVAPSVEGNVRNIYRFDLSSKELRVLARVSQLMQLLRTRSGDMYVIRWSANAYQLCHVERNGSLSVLHRFRNDADGHYPVSNLAEGPDGALYGYASNAGSSFDIVYRWTAANGMETYAEFPRTIPTLWENVKVVVGASGVVYVSTIARRQAQPIQTAQNYAISPDRRVTTLLESASPHVIGSDGTVYRSKPLTRSSYHGFQLAPFNP